MLAQCFRRRCERLESRCGDGTGGERPIRATSRQVPRGSKFYKSLRQRCELGICFPNLSIDQPSLALGRSRRESGQKLLALCIALSPSLYFTISFSHWFFSFESIEAPILASERLPVNQPPCHPRLLSPGPTPRFPSFTLDIPPSFQYKVYIRFI